MGHFVAVCGGVGGAKLAQGLQQILEPGALSVIVNTGDDFEHRGLPICPDLDTVLYTLAGVANPEQGWGRADETWQVQTEWRALGVDTWFQLGDKDIALHLIRRDLRSQGRRLTEVTRVLAQQLGVGVDILPMCDEAAPTRVATSIGELPFQEYFVRHRCAPAVQGFRYGAQSAATLSPEVRAALDRPDLEGIVLCPSNPYLSIAPILAVPGMRERLAGAEVPVLAVSPLIAGAAVKGPAAKIMNELGLAVSALEIARQYRDFVDIMLIDPQDEALIAMRAPGDPEIETAEILMTSTADRRRLAQICIDKVRRRGISRGAR
jgi:LPPG:FO 2-phospho-L-lactate transferase